METTARAQHTDADKYMITRPCARGEHEHRYTINLTCDADEDRRLIAAAPALLAALELTTQALVNLRNEGESRYLPIVKQALVALHEARGDA